MQESSHDFLTGDYFADHLPKFKVGQIVHHKRYDYRGVIVDFNMSCQADDNWYRQNQTQPQKNQPWYYVLVDRSTVVTYAAESSLEVDPRRKSVEHPLVEDYFDEFDHGQYHRNQMSWQGY